ncbi:MAG: DUF892 family protein [Rubricoccaceae bacterium]|nr:DUF892 family protein [Rubricoccaceae bacterium]
MHYLDDYLTHALGAALNAARELGEAVAAHVDLVHDDDVRHNVEEAGALMDEHVDIVDALLREGGHAVEWEPSRPVSALFEELDIALEVIAAPELSDAAVLAATHAALHVVRATYAGIRCQAAHLGRYDVVRDLDLALSDSDTAIAALHGITETCLGRALRRSSAPA